MPGDNQTNGESNDSKGTEAVMFLRDLLYCDQSLDRIATSFRGGPNQEPPQWLVTAETKLKAGDRAEAQEALLQATRDTTAETRYQLQAWSLLRELGYEPNEALADNVLGVVTEIGVQGGAVIVAGYADGDARFYWSTGGGMIGDMREIPDIAQAARDLVRTAQIVETIVPPGIRLSLPATGRVHFTLLTPGGMHVADLAVPKVEDMSNPLMPLYGATHALITQFRLLDERTKQARHSE
jgi:hypothetical protein